MPRGNNMADDMVTAKMLLLADAKAGKTEYALKSAEAGFNVLLMDGDVAVQTISAVKPEARHRIFVMDVSDRLDNGIDPRMIQIVADFFTSSTYLWNDTQQKEYSRTKDAHDPESGAALDEIWEFHPAALNHHWVVVLDSWTTLAYSGTLAKAQDMGVNVADVEKFDMNLYAGVNNRLTNMLAVIQKARCHFIVPGHPAQYEKTRSPDNSNAAEAGKMKNRIVEWTKMIPKSSSNPHGLTMGKFFSDVGWIDILKSGKRELNFQVSSGRVSGGHLEGKGDPRGDYKFVELLKKIGAWVPENPNNDLPLGNGLIIHPAGTFIPATKKPATLAIGSKPAASTPLESPAPTQVKGLGGLLKKPQ
jgi:hypothetical protein